MMEMGGLPSTVAAEVWPRPYRQAPGREAQCRHSQEEYARTDCFGPGREWQDCFGLGRADVMASVAMTQSAPPSSAGTAPRTVEKHNVDIGGVGLDRKRLLGL